MKKARTPPTTLRRPRPGCSQPLVTRNRTRTRPAGTNGVSVRAHVRLGGKVTRVYHDRSLNAEPHAALAISRSRPIDHARSRSVRTKGMTRRLHERSFYSAVFCRRIKPIDLTTQRIDRCWREPPVWKGFTFCNVPDRKSDGNYDSDQPLSDLENLSFVPLGALAPGSCAILSASLPHLLLGRVGTVAAMRRSHSMPSRRLRRRCCSTSHGYSAGRVDNLT